MKPFVTRASAIRCDAERKKYMWMHLGALVAAAPQRVIAQTGEVTDGSAWLLGPIGVVVVIGACAWAVLHVLRLRRRDAGRGADVPLVMAATALGARERVVVLRASGRVFLLGVTAQQVSMLAELHEEPRAAQPAGATPA
jgi:flagellar protein FliO/FliZ